MIYNITVKALFYSFYLDHGKISWRQKKTYRLLQRAIDLTLKTSEYFITIQNTLVA